MMEQPTGICAVLIAIACVTSAAQSQTEKCETLPHVTIPASDLPAVAAADCDLSRSRQYGSERKPDALDLYYSEEPGHFEKARYCAFSSFVFSPKTDAASAPRADEGLEGTNALTLAMIYANGEGVTRNLSLARQFVCQDNDDIAGPTPDEALDIFDKAIRNGGRFDACENGGNAFSRMVNYDCLGLQEQHSVAEISRREQSIEASSSPELKTSFSRLEAAYHAYQVAYSELEGAECEGGTGCGTISEYSNVAIYQTWISALVAIQMNSPPCSSVSPSDLAQLDEELNRQYKEALNNEYMDTSAEDQLKSPAPLVRAADRDWLRYRDAWVNYGKLRWPSIPSVQWRAWQTKDWIHLLTLN